MDPTALEAYASLQFPPDELHRPDGNFKKKKVKYYLVLASLLGLSKCTTLRLANPGLRA
jgi:hypothetical protein